MTSMDVPVCMLCGKGCGEGNQEATVAAMYQVIYQLTHVSTQATHQPFCFFPLSQVTHFFSSKMI